MINSITERAVRLETRRTGPGPFGAKTSELDKFKAYADQVELFIPGFVAFSIAKFTPALLRANILDEDGNIRPKEEHRPIKFTPDEERSLFTELEPLHSVPVAFRSDEPTAKGVGVFSTVFLTISANFEQFIQNDIPEIVNILTQQFSDAANAFKERTGLPHGIGLQVMPLVGAQFEFRSETILAPILSVSGFTFKDQNRVKAAFGFGLGGGVSDNAIGIGGIWFAHHFFGYNLEKKGNSIVNCYNPPSLFTRGNPEFNQAQLMDALTTKMLKLANLAGTDIYFEAQLVDLTGSWIITQISSHVWPDVKKPDGKIILYIEGHDDIVGSGIVDVICTSNRFLRTELSANKKYPPGAMVFDRFSRDVLAPALFHLHSDISVLFDSSGHVNNPVAHITGIMREAGIFYLHFPDDEMKIYRKVNNALSGGWMRKARRVQAWANELHGEGGIVAVD